MPEAGDDLFVWQERTTDTEPGGGWGTITALIPAFGVHGPLMSRRRDVAMSAFGPLARQHGRATGNPVRLARFALAEVEEQH